MKRHPLILASLLSLATLPVPARADAFTERELTFQVMNLLDAAQTASLERRLILTILTQNSADALLSWPARKKMAP